MSLDPQIAVTAVASTGAGALMLLAGVQKHALEWRRRRRVCPSCGRRLDGRVRLSPELGGLAGLLPQRVGHARRGVAQLRVLTVVVGQS